MTHRPGIAAVLLVVLVAATACGSDDDVQPIGGPTPTPTATADPTPSPEPEEPAEVDITSVPERLDAGYVEAVLAAHDEAMTEGVRAGVEAGGPAEAFLDFASAWWTERWNGRVQQVWLTQFEQEGDQFREDLEVRYHEVVDLVVAQDDCIVATTRVDNTAWTDVPEMAVTLDQVTALVLSPDDVEDERNPTPWVVAFDAALTDGEPSDALCDAT